MKNTHFIKSDCINMRLDRWFKKYICDVPQSLIERTLRKGKIKVNNKKEKSSYKLKKNDKISIFNFEPIIKKQNKQKYLPKKKEIINTSKFIIENNDNFIIINKPAGIAVQSGTKSKRNILDILSKTKYFDNSKPYAVHRIDKETTGVLIVAKNRKYAQLFTSLFRIRKIYKTYLSVVLGKLENDKGIFEDTLFYYENDKKISTSAISYYQVLDSNDYYSLLILKPKTGRKHQLRKQLLIHNHPILGDNKYKNTNNIKNKKSRLMLHAYKIKFSIDNIDYEYIAKPDEDFKNIINQKYLKSSFL